MTLNYFNYFTEVEEEFVRRRGKPLLVSPLDWALIESWKSAGIPLHVVLRAINQAFDAYDARPRKHRKVNSVFYCQQEVEATYAEYRLAQVGAGTEGDQQQSAARHRKGKASSAQPSDSLFAKPVLLDFISRSENELAAAAAYASSAGRSQVVDAIARACARLAEMARGIEAAAGVDSESLERDLDGIDRVILESLARVAGEAELKSLRAEAESQLSSYRNKMDKMIYEQTIENFVRRRLREMNQIPRLSLFYI